MLLLLGAGFFFGGLNRIEQFLNRDSFAARMSSLLVALAALMIPTLMTELQAEGLHTLLVSRGVAVILLITYLFHLIFNHRTHFEMFNAPGVSATVNPNQVAARRVGHTKRALAMMGISATIPVGDTVGSHLQAAVETQEEEHEEEPALSLLGTVITLVVFTALIGFHAEFATSSLTGLIHDTNISTTFLGLVVFPVLGLDPGCIAAGVKDKQYLNVDNSLSRSSQLTLFLAPFLVILGWILSIDMSLDFGIFPLICMGTGIVVTIFTLKGGKSDWYTCLRLTLLLCHV